MPTITIHRSALAQCWLADFAQADNAQEVQQLFGTTVLPTPYTEQASVDTVLKGLTKNNPGHIILVRQF